MSDPLASLNKAQLAAATAVDGPVAIIAGPGTGKTKTLTARIAYLLQRGVPAEKILALTFTNKAAREMRQRMAQTIQGLADLEDLHAQPYISTFHGLCYDLLGNGSDLQIIPEADRLELLRSLPQTGPEKLNIRELSTRISRAKSVLPGEHTDGPWLSMLLASYTAALAEQKRCDFDDLLQMIHQKLTTEPDVRAVVQNRWQYILVDEFQDTNALQYALLKLLTTHDNFFVIGDPLQSIYSFRGANGDIFNQFEQDFPGLQNIALTTNYRSVPQVVWLANAVFPDAPQLAPATTEQGSVQLVTVLNEYREAEWVVRAIEQDLGGTDFERSHRLGGIEREAARFGDYAVLYRTHHVAKALKRAFTESGLPYQCVGEESPYMQKPLRTAIACLRRIADPEYVLSPGDARLIKDIPKRLLDELTAKKDVPPTELLQAIIETCGLATTPNSLRDVHQALGALARFDDLPIRVFLARFGELAEEDFYEPTADAVTLLSIHASKGLEFGHVFLLAAEDGILPHWPANKHAVGDVTPVHLAEEKRLFYVAATRAKNQLTLLHAQTRAGQPTKLSPFAADLTEENLPRHRDPELASQQRTQRKRALKNAQGSLF